MSLLATSVEVPLPMSLPVGAQVYVVVNPTRARVDKEKPPEAIGFEWIPDLGQVLHGESFEGRDPLPNVVGFSIELVPVEKRAKSLRLRTYGDPLEVVKLVVPVSSGVRVYSSPRAPCADLEDLWQVDSELPVDQHVFGPCEFLEELRKRIDDEQDPVRTQSRFFFALDKETSVILASDESVGILDQALSFVSPAVRRSLQRRYPANRNHNGGYSPLAHGKLGEYLEFFTEIFWRLLCEHFPHPQPPAASAPKLPPQDRPEQWFDLRAFERAFEAFADGGLRRPVQIPKLALPRSFPATFAAAWATQPSSGFFFLFGELALVCAESRIRPQFWLCIANAMIRSQHLFAARYRPRVAVPAGQNGYRMLDYRACNHRPGDSAKIPQGYDTKLDLPSLAVAAGENAHQYVAGELLP